MRTLIDVDDAPLFAVPTVNRSGSVRLREGMLVEGPQGWGEFSPGNHDRDFVINRWLTSAIEPGTVGWPDPVRGRVPIAITVPAVDPDRAHQIVVQSGCRSAAVKVADHPSSLDDDVARLAAVRDALGPTGAIRCDADGRWDVPTAVAAINALENASGGLEFVEQPCHDLGDVAAVRRRVDVRIAVDQSIRNANEPHAVPLPETADIAVLSCGPLGGVRRTLRLAEAWGMPCVVSSVGASSVGLSAGLALAGALQELPFACGLDAGGLRTGDLVSAGRSLLPVDGYLPVAPMPPAPDPTLLSRFAVTDPDRLAWWRSRIRSAL
jgi:o-succinylbenzoate synthase